MAACRSRGGRWGFYHYGLWAAEVHDRIEPALEAIEATRHSIELMRYDDDIVRWGKTDDELFAKLERELPKEVARRSSASLNDRGAVAVA